ncbi:MAG TPA: TolC family protein [Polyangiaceae bacterium]|nr:TolC family protein [Polyangiaceae bacterium]
MASIRRRLITGISGLIIGSGALTGPRTAAGAEPAPATAEPPAPVSPVLRELIALARQRAPEVAVGRAALGASRSSYAAASLAPVGNPAFEVKVDHGMQGVTKDVTIDASVWLPVELAGEKQSRGREAREFVGLHEALLEQARAAATGRTVRAFGGLAVAQARARVLTELLAVARAEATHYSDRLAAGDATERDAALASLDAARNDALLSEAQVDVMRYAGELTELTGRKLEAGTNLAEIPPAYASKRTNAQLARSMPSARVLEAQARYYASAGERLKREAYHPLAFGLTGGRGDFGEARFGGGIAYAWPLFRSNQPERARAQAEKARALEELNIRRDLVARRVGLLEQEIRGLHSAIAVVRTSALPAAQRAVQAALDTSRAGKGDWLTVLVSRRELSALWLRHLELLERTWLVLAELVELTGELP